MTEHVWEYTLMHDITELLWKARRSFSWFFFVLFCFYKSFIKGRHIEEVEISHSSILTHPEIHCNLFTLISCSKTFYFLSCEEPALLVSTCCLLQKQFSEIGLKQILDTSNSFCISDLLYWALIHWWTQFIKLNLQFKFKPDF